MVLEKIRKLSNKSSTPISDSDYLRKYRAEIRKFEEDRKRALYEFEKNKKSRTWAFVNGDLSKKNQVKPDSDVESGKSVDTVSSNASTTTEEDKSHRKLDLFKEKFIEWSSYSTAHGIPNIFRVESRLLQVIWVLCFLASFAYCSYTIVNIIVVFLQYEVLIKQEVVTEPPVNFPAVTVCNLNAFDRRSAQPYINQVLAKNNISYVSDIKRINIPPTKVNNLIKASIIGNKSLTSADIRNMGFSIDYMLLTCYFNNIPCNQSDFRWVYDFDYTNCWQFNSGFDQDGNPVPVRQVNEAGADRSLNLELFIGDDNTQSQYMLNSGARVVVHSQNTTPIISSEGLDIATGFKTNVAFRRSFLSRLESPFSNCIKDNTSPNSYHSAYYKAIFNTLNMNSYRQKVCMRICLQAFILERCECLDGSLPNIYQANNRTELCQSLGKLDCIANARISYFGDKNSSNTECVSTQCPSECNSETFEITTSSSRYPTSYYQSYLREQTNILSKFPAAVPPEITKTTVYLSVFFDEIATTYTEEIPAITGTSVLGTIGGNLGLFIGASLLTFIEIVELLIEFVFIALNFRF